jgi:hypothetical protein
MKAGCKIALLACSVLFWALFGVAAYADKRVALVVGNSGYARVTKLANPENDAQDLAEALRGLNFEVIFKINSDMRGLDSALEEFERKAQGSDTALFFFAGHGLQYRGQNYLLPIDADLEDEVSLKYNTLAIEKVRQALDSASGVKIMILDACRNNPLAANLVARTAGLSRSAELTRGLARLDRTEGMVVAYATQADQVAQDGSGRNSPFSSALVRRLKEPNLEIATLFRRVAQDVYEQTGGKQRPELSISLLQDFYLNLHDDDSRVWRRIGPNATEAELKEFVTKFPGSPFVRDAQNRIYVLESARRERDTMSERIAKLEAERLQFQKREDDRLVAEQREKEKRDKERADLERLAIDRQNKERQEAERREAERLAKQKLEQEQLEKARVATEKAESDRREVARIAAERLEKQRLEAENQERAHLEALRVAAEQQEKQRQDSDRLAKERLEKERLASDQRERERLQVERLAAEKKEQERLAADKREAEKREAKRVADQKRETEKVERVKERLAALEMENRQKSEAAAAQQKQAETCAHETADFNRLAGENQRDGLQKLKAQVTCPGLVASIDKAVTNILKAQVQACSNENRALRKIGDGDLAALKVFVIGATCETARKSASDKAEKIEAQIAKTEAICASEAERLGAIKAEKAEKSQIYSELMSYQKQMSCEKLRPSVADAAKYFAPVQPSIDTPDQVKTAQIELKRIGCYSGDISGSLTKNTKAALESYFQAQKTPDRQISVDDKLLDDLKGQPVIVCTQPDATSVEKPAQPQHPLAAKPKRHAPAIAREEPVEEPVVRHRAKPVRAERESPPPVTHAAAPRPAAAARPPGPTAAAPHSHSPAGISGVGF